MLTKFIENKKSSWEDFLDTCIYAYNTAVHESSRFTPYELMFGRKAVLLIDLKFGGEASDILCEHRSVTKVNEGGLGCCNYFIQMY